MYHTTQTELKHSHELYRMMDQPFLLRDKKNSDNPARKSRMGTESKSKKNGGAQSKKLLTGKASQPVCSWETEPYPQEELDNSFVLGNN